MAGATETSRLDINASEQAVRIAVARALVGHGATVVRNEPGTLVAESGSAAKTMLYGAFVGVESFPLGITLSLAPAGEKTTVNILIEPRGVGRMAGGLFASVVVPVRGGKAAQAWMDRTVQAVMQVDGAPAAAPPPAAPSTAPAVSPPPAAAPPAPAAPAPAVPVAAAPASDAAFCPNCGTGLPADARFCPQCGTQRAVSA